jgi:hypothetical protein
VIRTQLWNYLQFSKQKLLSADLVVVILSEYKESLKAESLQPPVLL